MERVTEKIKKTCRLLMDGRCSICIHHQRQGLRIVWDKNFMEQNKEQADELTTLVYRDDDMLKLLGSLTDGMYGPHQLWRSLTEGHYDDAN